MLGERDHEPHRAGDADGRSAPHGQCGDGVTHIVDGAQFPTHELGRKPALIYDVHCVAWRGPPHCLDFRHIGKLVVAGASCRVHPNLSRPIMRIIPLLAVLLCVTLPLAAQSPDLSARLPLDTIVHRGVLANGLRYVIRRNGRPEKRAELRLVVNAGSILEDDAQRGLAHFVEHMAFNGTKRFPKGDIVNFLERVGMRFGADLNASTSFDETVYTLQIPTDTARLVDTALDIMEDWAHGLLFDPAELKKERGVVIEEWRTGLSAETRVQNKQFPVMLHGS